MQKKLEAIDEDVVDQKGAQAKANGAIRLLKQNAENWSAKTYAKH